MSQALSLSTTDSVVNRTVSILNRLFLAPRAFKIRLWNGTELSASSRPAFSLILNYPGALRRMFTPPIELALGEAFIYGDFDIDGDIFSAFTLFDVIWVQLWDCEHGCSDRLDKRETSVQSGDLTKDSILHGGTRWHCATPIRFWKVPRFNA